MNSKLYFSQQNCKYVDFTVKNSNASLNSVENAYQVPMFNELTNKLKFKIKKNLLKGKQIKHDSLRELSKNLLTF